MTRSLVTGGNGFFGSLLVERLLDRGDDVRVLDVDPTGSQPADVDVVDRRHQGCRRRSRAPSTASTSCTTTSPRSRWPRTLPCCARSTSTARRCCSTHPGTAGSARSCTRRRARCSGSRSRTRSPRTTVPRPLEPYGAAKLAAEWACLRAASLGQDVTIVRPRTILGHGRLGIFGILFDWIADGADPYVLGDGSNRYQFVHADDLAALCIAAASVARAGGVQCRDRPLRDDARGTRARLPPRRDRVPGQVVARPTRRDRDAAHCEVRPHPVCAISLADVLAVDVVRHDARDGAARLDAALVERRDARPELRLVRRQPSAGDGRPVGFVTHRRSARSPLLSLLKRLSTPPRVS